MTYNLRACSASRFRTNLRHESSISLHHWLCSRGALSSCFCARFLLTAWWWCLHRCRIILNARGPPISSMARHLRRSNLPPQLWRPANPGSRPRIGNLWLLWSTNPVVSHVPPGYVNRSAAAAAPESSHDAAPRVAAAAALRHPAATSLVGSSSPPSPTLSFRGSLGRGLDSSSPLGTPSREVHPQLE